MRQEFPTSTGEGRGGNIIQLVRMLISLSSAIAS